MNEETKLPDLPTIDVKDSIPYESIRYIPGYPQAFVRRYATEYAQAAIRARIPIKVSTKYDNVLVPFLALMERELHANTGKGDRPGWLRMSPMEAILEVHHHVAKLQRAMLENHPEAVREYAADVANMAMMAADVCGVLLPQTPVVCSGACRSAGGGDSDDTCICGNKGE